jgi:sulfoxide reductase heme-binding subunit YedZ
MFKTFPIRSPLQTGGVKKTINTWARALPSWVVYSVGMLPALIAFYQGATGGLGAEPIKALEHELGEFGLKLLIIGLMITPLRVYGKIQLFKFRRAFGLLAFIYVMLHFAVWALLDLGDVALIWADLTKRPYIILGMIALVMLIPLAATSNNYAQRAMRGGWGLLHRLTYPVALLSGLHFIWLRKGFQIEPLAYFAVIAALLLLRVPAVQRVLRRG